MSPLGLALIAISGPLASFAGAVATALLWSKTHGLPRDAMNARARRTNGARRRAREAERRAGSVPPPGFRAD